MRIAVINLAVILGVVALVRGAWLAWVPAGWLMLGVLLLSAALKLSGPTKAK